MFGRSPAKPSPLPGLRGIDSGEVSLRVCRNFRAVDPFKTYGGGFDAGPPQVGAGPLSFYWFSMILVFFLGPSAGFPTFSAHFRVGVLAAVFLSTETLLY